MENQVWNSERIRDWWTEICEVEEVKEFKEVEESEFARWGR